MLQSKDKNNFVKGQTWYSSWFNEEIYDEVYGHRSELEAEVAVNLLRKLVEPYIEVIERSYILDVCCGSCRHLPYLNKLSEKIIGLDLSFRQLLNGQNILSQLKGKLENQLVRSDMRYLPFQESSLGLITNFFTSFGYFSCDTEHQKTLCNWTSSLKKGGILFIDLMNKDLVIDNLLPLTTSKFKHYDIEQHRKVSYDRKRVEKKITISTGKDFKIFNESVRLFSLEEVSKMLFHSGLKIQEIRGSYSNLEYTNSSERLIILAQKI